MSYKDMTSDEPNSNPVSKFLEHFFLRAFESGG